MSSIYQLRWLVPALVACSVLTGYLGWKDSDSLGNYLLNSSTELLGIALTVAVIDRLLELREKRRWKPYTDL